MGFAWTCAWVWERGRRLEGKALIDVRRSYFFALQHGDDEDSTAVATLPEWQALHGLAGATGLVRVLRACCCCACCSLSLCVRRCWVCGCAYGNARVDVASSYSLCIVKYKYPYPPASSRALTTDACMCRLCAMCGLQLVRTTCT
eukprot:scaffold19972_cov128-Isochrysis_galbana.AAC.5